MSTTQAAGLRGAGSRTLEPEAARTCAEGAATRSATSGTQVPSVAGLRGRWLPAHRWVAERGSDTVLLERRREGR